MQLKQITGQYLELSNLASDPDTDLKPCDIKDTLDSISAEFEDKAKAVAAVINDVDLDVSKIDAEIERLTKRKKVIENRRDSIKDYLKQNMAALGIKNIKCPFFSITLAEGRNVVSIYDESIIEPNYLNVSSSIKPNKAAILKALNNDPDSVPGASLVKSEPSLRIK